MINLSLPKLCYALGSVFSACVLLLVVVSTINGRLKKFKSLKRNSFKHCSGIEWSHINNPLDSLGKWK